MSTKDVTNFDFTSEFNEILERMAFYSPEIVKGDSDIARALEVSRTTPSTWRKRGKLPLEAIVEYAKNRELNIHWLLTGEGEPELSQMSTSGRAQHYDNARDMYLDDAEAAKRVQERAKPELKRMNEALGKIDDNLTLDHLHPNYELVRTMLFKLSTQTNCEKCEFEKFIHYLNHHSNSPSQGDLTRSIRVVSTILGARWGDIDETAKAKLIAKTYEYFQQIDDDDQQAQEQVMGKIMNEVLTSLS